MAQLALAGAGAVLGGAVGSALGYASIGASIGWALGGLAGGMLFGPRLPDIQGPRLTDLSVQTSSYGIPIPIVYGTVKVAGNIIWAKPIREQIVRRRVRGGKGGMGGRRQNVTEYQYFGTWASAFCEGPIDKLLRIWFDSHLVYDETGSSEIVSIPGLTFRVYSGTETQLPDPAIEQDVGAANVTAFRGLCYVVFENVPLAKVGNRIPSVSVEVTKNSSRSYTVQQTSSVLANSYPQYASSSLDSSYHCPLEKKSYFLFTTGSLSGTSGIEVVDWENMTRYVIGLEIATACTGLAVMDDYIAVTGGPSGFSNRSPVLCFNKNTGALIGSYGTSASLTIFSSSNGIANGNQFDPALVVRVLSLTGYEYYYIRVPKFNSIWISKLPNGPYITGSGSSTENHINDITPTGGNLENLLCPGEERPGESVFYHFFSYNNTSSPTVFLHVYTLRASAIGTPFNTFGVSIKKYSYTLTQLGGPTNNLTVSAAGLRFLSCIYDAVDNSAVFHFLGNFVGGTRDVLCKIREDGTVVWGRNFPSDTFMPNMNSRSGKLGAIIIGSQSVLYKNDGAPLPHRATVIDFRTGNTEIQENINDASIPSIPVTPLPCHFPDERAYCYRTSAGQYAKFRFPFYSGQGTLLSTIVSDLCQRAGLDTSDIDVSALTESVRGFVISRQGSARSALEPLAMAFNFDAVERGSTLVFRKRNGSSVATIPLEDYVRDENNLVLEEQRAQDSDLFRTIFVRYIDLDRTYEIGTQQWSRPWSPEATMASRGQTTIDLPIVLTADEAKTIARRVLLSSWQERVRYKFKLTQKHLRLEPTDPITITRPDNSFQRVRIISTRFEKDWFLDVEAVEESGTVYPTVSADAGSGTPVPVINVPGACIPFAPRLPLMRAQNDTNGQGLLYYAAASTEKEKPFSVVTLHVLEGSAFNPIGDLIEDVAWGDVVGTVPLPPSFWTWDRSTVLTVVVSRGFNRFVSETELNVLNGANTAILFNDTQVEVIQFQTVTVIDANTVQLSNLLRGRFGTEDGPPFPGGARIVLFDQGFVPFVAQVSNLNTQRRLRFPRAGEDVSFAKEISYVVDGRAEQPWAPCHIVGTRNTANDLTITWVRRTRFNGELVDFTGTVPLNEQSEAYDVEIRDIADTTTLRTFSNLSSPTVTYTASQQTADGITPGDPVRVRVYQLSALVGRGRMGTAVV